MPWLDQLRDRLRLSLWLLPGIFALVAAALALALGQVDRVLRAESPETPILFQGTAEGARSILSTIAQSMLTFTGLVFTITMLVLQLASNQLSPRVMRTFLRDRANQSVLGLFVATFVYTLLVLREVRSPIDGDGGFVPAISIWVAFVMLLASVGAFIYYIDHMAHGIRASTVIAAIWRETSAAIERLYPERVGREPERIDPPVTHRGQPDVVLTAPAAGVVTGVDDEDLLEASAAGDRLVEVLPVPGDFVAEGQPIIRLWGDWDRDAAVAVRDAVAVGGERTLHQDAAFGLRQLVDIALRALSPGTNDPTTAVQALDRIHDLLRRLAGRDIPSAVRSDAGGTVRLILHRRGWPEYLQLGLEEIRLAGRDQPQVTRRLRALLDDLASVAPDARQPAIRDAIRQLDREVEES